jgi:hypothetical protein
LSYVELYQQLSVDDWLDVSISLHFFEKHAVYHKVEYLDSKLSKALFSDSFSDYYDALLKEMNQISVQKHHIDELVLSTEELAQWLYNPNRNSFAQLLGSKALR